MFVQSTLSFTAKGKGNVTSNVGGLMLIFFKKKIRGFNQSISISVFILGIMLKVNFMINKNIIFNKFKIGLIWYKLKTSRTNMMPNLYFKN
jgi:hypothetical protein